MWSDHTSRIRDSFTGMTGLRPRAHEEVLRWAEEEMTSGRLTIGARLPGERPLAAQLGVSRASVREAIRVLEAMGLVQTAAGSGPESGAVIVARPDVAIGTALSMHLSTSHLPVADIVQTRVLLESWAVTTAAQYADASHCVHLAGLLDAMDDPRLSPDEFHRLDAQFHVALSELSGNAVISAIMTSLRESIRGYVMDGVRALPDWPTMASRLRREHRGILRAVESGEGERAALLVRRHIEGFHHAATKGR